MNLFEKIKKFTNIDSNTFIANLVTILAIGIIILIAISTFGTEKDKENTFYKDDSLDSLNNSNQIIEDYANLIETKLEEILSKISDVGQVSVMITLEDTAERMPAFNTTESEEMTEEEDSQGGKRNIIKKDFTQQVVLSNDGGNSLVILKEIKPKVRGVIVVAEGAHDIEVKEKLYNAVKTVLGISGNKVEIYSSN